MKIQIAAVAAAVMLTASPVLAEGQQDFTLTNKTGKSITHVYVSESDNEKWEDDVLGTDVLENGDETNISFTGYGDDVCKFDVKVVVEGGKSWIVSDIDLCEINNVTFKLQGNKMVYVKQ
jgi:hypothetical protein